MTGLQLPQLWFHIGDPKTGTTSIQTALHRGAWDCPTVRLTYPDHLSDAKLAKAIYISSRRNQRPDLFAATARWLAAGGADVAVISAEHFSHVTPLEMQSVLIEHLPDHAVGTRFVAYVRPHAQRVLSAFAQQTKCGAFHKDLEAFHALTLDRGFFTYAARFAAWHDMFGDRFVLRPMVRDELRDGNVVADFLQVVLGGAAFALKDVPVTNESLTVAELACLREVQLVLRQQGVVGAIRVAVGSHFGNLLNAGGSRRGERPRLHRSLVEQIRRNYLDDARALDASFFPGRTMERAFEAAMAEAAPVPFRNDIEHYADAAAIALIRNEAKRLASLLDHSGKSWRRARLAAIGQESGAVAHDAPTQAGIKAIDLCCDAIATAIVAATA